MGNTKAKYEGYDTVR